LSGSNRVPHAHKPINTTMIARSTPIAYPFMIHAVRRIAARHPSGMISSLASSHE
jgi:hypothetical protein